MISDTLIDTCFNFSFTVLIIYALWLKKSIFSDEITQQTYNVQGELLGEKRCEPPYIKTKKPSMKECFNDALGMIFSKQIMIMYFIYILVIIITQKPTGSMIGAAIIFYFVLGLIYFGYYRRVKKTV
ncbi:hypothetical protein NLU03_24965 [Bacillus toyonensis]|nr:hypothetical protein [Bacillus toyonensis]